MARKDATSEPLPMVRYIEEFCLKAPLYESFSLPPEQVHKIESYQGPLDTFCTNCKRESTLYSFNAPSPLEAMSRAYTPPGQNEKIFALEFACTRCSKIALRCHFLFSDPTFIKIGQYPSLADLSQIEISKYRLALTPESYKEFSRGIGLAAHGIGIGCFAYFRRVFEGLIYEALHEAKKLPGWDDEQFRRSRMDARIGLLKSFLPDFLVENRGLYSIMSKGIHELTEQECLEAFPVIKLGIQLILDEKIAKLEKEKRVKEASKTILAMKQKLEQI